MFSFHVSGNGALAGTEGRVRSKAVLGFAKVDDQARCRTKIADDQVRCRPKIVDDQEGCRTKLALIMEPK